MVLFRSPLQQLSSLQYTFGSVQAQLAKETKKVEKAEGKLKLVMAGFEKRAAAAAEQLLKRAADRDEKCVRAMCWLVSLPPVVLCVP